MILNAGKLVWTLPAGKLCDDDRNNDDTINNYNYMIK